MQRCFGSLHDEVRKGAATGLERYQIEPLVPYTGLMAGSGSRTVRALDKWFLYRWRVARSGKHELVHALSHGSGHLLPHLKGTPRTLATIHDLIPLRYPGGLSESQLGRIRKQVERLARFDLLAAVSGFTAGEVAELAGIPRERIRVVENGIDQELFRSPVDLGPSVAHLAESPYVLSVSSAAARKNLGVFPEVFAEVFANHPELRLVRVGETFPPELRARFVKLCGEQRLIELGRVGDEVLVPLFQHAALFFFPSLYEGFGLPVIEAMAAGCPVVCSNTSSLPEVGGEAAVFVDPTDPSSAAAGVCEALVRREDLVSRGRAHSRKFTWQRSLEGYLACYEELVG